MKIRKMPECKVQHLLCEQHLSHAVPTLISNGVELVVDKSLFSMLFE